MGLPFHPKNNRRKLECVLKKMFYFSVILLSVWKEDCSSCSLQLHFVTIHVVHQKLSILYFVFKQNLWQQACEGVKHFVQCINPAGFHPIVYWYFSSVMPSSCDHRKSSKYFQILSHGEMQNMYFNEDSHDLHGREFINCSVDNLVSG